jgi:hypothetical protein
LRSVTLSSVQIIDERSRLVADGSSMCFVRPSGGGPPPAMATAGTPEAERASTVGAREDPHERPELARRRYPHSRPLTASNASSAQPDHKPTSGIEPETSALPWRRSTS